MRETASFNCVLLQVQFNKIIYGSHSLQSKQYLLKSQSIKDVPLCGLEASMQHNLRKKVKNERFFCLFISERLTVMRFGLAVERK